mgnify:CR=1 FL=1
MGIRIEDEFAALALKSTNPPTVAGRCSVFAKSDMIHLQQKATPDYDILMGLCVGLARNLKSNLGRGHDIARPIAFGGGVASNSAVVRALEMVFELERGELIVPPEHAVTGAYGAILVQLRNGQATPLPNDASDRLHSFAIEEQTVWEGTFGRVPVGASLLMVDSEGNLELADNQGDAASRLGLTLDRPVRIRSA